MKPENVLCVTRLGNRVKLIDFGLARRFDPKQKLQVMFGTPDFAAPEVLSYERVTPAADMWSVGVICYVLLSGLSPFMGNSDLETMTNVTRAVYDFDDEAFEPISPEAKDFIARLLVKQPEKRPKPSECLAHKWLAKTPAKAGKAPKLSKTKLKKYVVRRRWQKAVTAIMALTRMGANLSLTSGGAGSGAFPSGGGVRRATTSSTTSSSKVTSSSSVLAAPRAVPGKKPTTTTATSSSSAAATSRSSSSTSSYSTTSYSTTSSSTRSTATPSTKTATTTTSRSAPNYNSTVTRRKF